MLLLKSIPIENTVMLEEGSILFTSELHRNSRIQNYIDNGDFDSQKMLALLEGAPSIDEKYLAMIIQKAIKSVTLSNLGNIRSLLLQIITIPHATSQLRRHLKSQFKIQGILVMLLMWPQRAIPQARKYVSMMIDCYPVDIMLKGKDLIRKWLEYLRKQIQSLHAKDSLIREITCIQQGDLQQLSDEFDTVFIPL